ncbi:uncharacterized protein YukE [Streptacidiphilus sp. BW17]|uniref:WXG100 family type VII secretion target n=1 Tax=Streptacidiphilus sp. BW17 TaxID=3156274 RepID=UPI003513ACD5
MAGDSYYYEQQAYQEQQKEQKAADAQWKKALQANAGGQTGDAGFTTNFEAAKGFEALQAMVRDADPGAISQAALNWGYIADNLHDTAKQLGGIVNDVLEHWTGQTADAFRHNATQLHTSLVNGAGYASNTKEAMTSASTALGIAKDNFPHAPSEMAQIGSSLGGSSNIQFENDAAKYGLAKAVQMDGGQLSVWEQVHQQAVVVMEGLGTQYNQSTLKLSSTPGGGTLGDVGTWPAPPVTQVPGPPSGTVTGTPSGPGQAGNVPLKPITGGNATGGTFTPGVNNGGSVLPGGGGVGGIHGGAPGGNGWGIGGKLDGVSGGLHSGLGAGGGFGGGGGVGGVGGLGVGGGAGGVGLGGGGMVGMSGLGAGGMTGGTGSGSASGEAAGVSEEGAMAGEGEGAAGAGGESGMGAGGLGGLANAAGKKKQRKSRAEYLVEDEETWGVDTPVNPGVITF